MRIRKTGIYPRLLGLGMWGLGRLWEEETKIRILRSHAELAT